MAMKTADGSAVSTMPKYRNPNSPVTAAPIMNILRRPMRSEMWPEIGMAKNSITAATITAVRMKFRGIFKVPTV